MPQRYGTAANLRAQVLSAQNSRHPFTSAPPVAARQNLRRSFAAGMFGVPLGAASSSSTRSVLKDFTNGVLGRSLDLREYQGPGRGEIEESFEQNLAQIYARADTPRLSGVQIKAPMYLDEKGILSPASGRPFTHILKPAGTSGYDALPVIEWIAMQLGRTAGLDAPAIALVAMPDKMPPALIVERFDIREGASDTRLIALEDMCSVLDLPSSAKYDATMERVARAVRPLSTAPEDDLLIIVKRALFAWLIADGDMHLKNMALLKIATTAGVRAGDAETAIDDVLNELRTRIDGIAVPHAVEVPDPIRKLAAEALTLCRQRIDGLAPRV